MPRPVPMPQDSSQPRTFGAGEPVVDSPEPVCVVCGGLREARKVEACSAKCRAALSRRRQREALRAGLLLLRAQVDELLARVERHEPKIPVDNGND